MSNGHRRVTITRNAHSRYGFTQINNSLLRDTTLSGEARGFLTYMLSLPVTWIFHISWAQKQLGYSEKKIRKICQELLDKGYMKRHQERGDNGRMGEMVYLFTDVANEFVLDHDEDPELGSPSDGMAVLRFPDDRLAENRLAVKGNTYKETGKKETREKDRTKKETLKKTNICHNVELKHETTQQTQHTDFFFHGEPSESATPTVSCESDSELEKAPLQNGDPSFLIPETWSSGGETPEQQTEDSLFDLRVESEIERARQAQCQKQQPKDTPKGTPSLEICSTRARETNSPKTIHMLSTGCPQDINNVYGTSVDNGGQNDLFHGDKTPSAEPAAPTAPRTPDVCATAAKRKTRRTAAQIGYSLAFDRFWEAYPAKRGMSRPAAFKNWLAQDCELVAEDVIMGAKEYADDVDTSRRKNKGWSDAYIKHAQGWLTERRWEGYVAEVKKREAERIKLEEWRAAEIQRQEAEAAAKAAIEEETLEERRARCAERDRLRLIEDAKDIASIVVQCAELEKDKNSYVSTRLWEKLVAELRCLTKMLMPKRWRDFSRYPRETVEIITKALTERGLLDMLNRTAFAAAPA